MGGAFLGSNMSGEEVLKQLADLDARLADIESALYARNIQSAAKSKTGADMYLSAAGLNIKNSAGAIVGQWQQDGDVFFGTNVASPPSGVTIAIFNTAQTYNGESVGVGDMLFGNNSSGKANMLWDASAGILYFRGGTTPQVYINTTGDLYAGGGHIRLNADGLEVRNDSSQRYIALYNSLITGYAGAVGYMNLDAGDPGGGTTGTTVLGIQHDSNNQSNVYCWLNEVDIIIKKGGSWRYVVEANYDLVNFNAPIRLSNIPTSSSGLSSGDVWNDSGTLKIV